MDVETHCSILYSSLCHLLLHSSNTVPVRVSFVLQFDFELYVEFPWVRKISLQKPILTFEIFLLPIPRWWCGRSSEILGCLSFAIFMSNSQTSYDSSSYKPFKYTTNFPFQILFYSPVMFCLLPSFTITLLQLLQQLLHNHKSSHYVMPCWWSIYTELCLTASIFLTKAFEQSSVFLDRFSHCVCHMLMPTYAHYAGQCCSFMYYMAWIPLMIFFYEVYPI